MKFTILSILIAATSAMKTSHPKVKSLLEKSRRLEDADQEADYSWIADFSIVFDSCHVVDTYNFEENEGGIVRNNLVKFKLCPSNNCMTSCTGAEYMAPMDEFVNSYTEWKMNDVEYRCEQVRENCDCENRDDDEGCETECYTDAGMYDDCVEQEKGDDDGYDFNLQEWLECSEIDYESDDDTKYYVGPKCSSNGQAIHLAVFRDEDCTQDYDDGIFMTTYKMSLPYSSSNIVAENCISCTSGDANNGAYYYDKDITEICEESYVKAARCETNLYNQLSYVDETGCEYMTTVESLSANQPSSTFAWVMVGFFAIASAGLAFLATQMHMSTRKRQINLSDDSAVV